MALPLLFFIGSSIVRAATPTIARLLVKQGYKRASSAVVKNTLKTAKKIRTIGKKKDIPIAKNKSLTVPKNQSTALTKINKVTSGGKSSNVGAKVIGGGATVISGAAALSTDKKKGDAKADSNKKKQKVSTAKKRLSPGALGGKKYKTDVSQGSTSSTMTFGKAFRAAKDAGKKEFTYRGKKYHTRTKDEEKKSEATKKFGMGKVDSLSKSKVEKKKVRKTDNMEGGTAPIKKKKEEPKKKKSKSFLDRVKSDFNKAVKETKRNISGDFKKKTGRYKSVSTGKTNFNKKKKKES